MAYGLLTLKEALDRYDLSDEEFRIWHEAAARDGERALKVTRIQKNRHH
ncbi:MAG: DUF1153 domain-containing protein [Paracoccaceae bacterium]